jgi:hypothetical protein
MERITTMMTNRQTRKMSRQEGKEEQQQSKGKTEALIRIHFRSFSYQDFRYRELGMSRTLTIAVLKS